MVTSPSIEEALAALDHLTGIRQAKCCAESSETIRSALATAAQEAEAWREIEAWLIVNPTRSIGLAIDPLLASPYRCAGFKGYGTLCEILRGQSRLAAIVAAGEYCRAEIEKR